MDFSYLKSKLKEYLHGRMVHNNPVVNATSRCLYAFVYVGQPRSCQSKNKDKFQIKVRGEFLNKYPAVSMQARVPLYCNVYYFHREHFSIDADNISKPVVDSLRGYAYEDDDLVKFRAAGKIDLGHYSVNELDLTMVPSDSFDALLNAISNEKHFLYIEVGTFAVGDFVFGR